MMPKVGEKPIGLNRWRLKSPSGLVELAFRFPLHGIAHLWLAALLLALGMQAPARAGLPLDTWRAEVTRIRALAENDGPQALQQAQHLESSLPPDATPADKARLLNLLSRIELYLALTDQAAQHAGQAFELARSHGDKLGQAEADLNVALTSVNQGKLDLLVEATTRSLQALDGTNRPDLLGEAMLRTVTMYRRVGQIDESVAMAVHAMEIARRRNDPLALTFAHQGLAVSYDQSFRQKEALDHYTQMRDQARAARSRQLEAYAVLGMGGLTATMGEPAGGERLTRQAIAMFREVGFPFALNFGRFQLAASLRGQKRHAEALALLDQVVETYERHPNRIGLWYSLNARSTTHQDLRQLAAARADARHAYALAKDIGFPLYVSESAQRLAQIAADEGDHRRAFELSSEAREMTDKATRERVGARMVELTQRYESESKQREIDELTLRNRQQTEQLEQQQRWQRWLWSVLGGSAVAFAVLVLLLGRLRRSQGELQQKTAILQSILDSMGDGVAVANQRGELVLVNPKAQELGVALSHGDQRDPKQRPRYYLPDQTTPCPLERLPLMKALRGESCDNAELFMRTADGSPGRWLSVTTRPLANADGIARGGVAVFSDVSERKWAERALREMNFRREAAREEERRYIARELHDELGQILSALRLEVSVLRMGQAQENPDLAAKAVSMLKLVDAVIRVQRDLVYSLRPAVLDMGIGPALEWLVGEFGDRSGIECELRMSETELGLDADQTTMVFRIVQESLTNITRHSQASRVDIALRRDGDDYCLTVQDDGTGFDTSSARNPKSLGLVGVQERAQMLGGQLELRSSPDSGVCIKVTFPPSRSTEQAGVMF